jgi:cell wall-associated NlpC family hydrolase
MRLARSSGAFGVRHRGSPPGTLSAVRYVLAVAVALAAAVPADAAFKPGQRAAIDVSVATLWKAPNLARAIDRPSLTNPVDPAQWSRNLATTESRAWLDSRVQTEALYGQQVVVLARSGGWAKVAVVDEPDPQNRHGYPGWLPVSQLAPDFDRQGKPVVVLARTGTLHVRGRTLELSYGTALPSLSNDRVRTPDGIGTITGAATPLTPTNASIIAQAKRFLGTHYLWGGLSSWGFDCSGIIWAVYRAHGVTIPRDAEPQRRYGTAVARTALRPGDLLFFGSPSYAGHDAVYLGNDRMLEAPDSAHRVRIVPVRWMYYIGARRYLTR